ncbi:hypothetical protein Sm713_76000 [Streptomyces sp. TS71-3]|nr:hypothetical protein Sm713_76000 [Streptomyces sp. TS71-3]
MDQHTVASAQPEGGQVTGQPPGLELQLRVGHAVVVVLEGDLAALAPGVLHEELRHGTDEGGAGLHDAFAPPVRRSLDRWMTPGSFHLTARAMSWCEEAGRAPGRARARPGARAPTAAADGRVGAR